MLRNKKAQATGTPINTIVVLIVIVLVIAGIFYLIIRAELTKKFEELPGPSEREETVTIEVKEVCPIESGGIVSFVSIQKKKFGLDMLAKDITKHVLCPGNSIDSCVCSPSKVEQCENGNYFYLDLVKKKIFLNKRWGDTEIGIITDHPDKIKIYCEYFDNSSKAYKGVEKIIPNRKELFMYNNACYGGASVSGVWKLYKEKQEIDIRAIPKGCALRKR